MGVIDQPTEGVNLMPYACCSHCLIDCDAFADHIDPCYWGCHSKEAK